MGTRVLRSLTIALFAVDLWQNGALSVSLALDLVVNQSLFFKEVGLRGQRKGEHFVLPVPRRKTLTTIELYASS